MRAAPPPRLHPRRRAWPDRRLPPGLGLLQLPHLLDEQGHRLLPVGHQRPAGRLEDVGLGVLVDGHDVLHLGDAGHVLGGAGDAHGDVEVGGHHLAREPHLGRDRIPAQVAGGARGAHRPAQQLGQLLQQLESLWPSQPPSARDDDAGVLQPHPFRLLLDPPQDAGTHGRGVQAHLHLLHLPLARLVALQGLLRLGPQGDDHRRGVEGVAGVGVAAVAGAGDEDAPVPHRHLDGVHGHGGAQAGGQPRRQVAPDDGLPEEHRRRPPLLHQAGQHRHAGIGLAVLQQGVVGQEHHVGPLGDGVAGLAVQPRAQDGAEHLPAQGVGQAAPRPQQLQGDGCQPPLLRQLAEDQDVVGHLPYSSPSR